MSGVCIISGSALRLPLSIIERGSPDSRIFAIYEADGFMLMSTFSEQKAQQVVGAVNSFVDLIKGLSDAEEELRFIWENNLIERDFYTLLDNLFGLLIKTIGPDALVELRKRDELKEGHE